jgi:predicted amidohydrolase
MYMHVNGKGNARHTILQEARFQAASAGWDTPRSSDAEWEYTPQGLLLSAPGDGRVSVPGPGVHTRNGDTIELCFRLLGEKRGTLKFGFSGGFEAMTVALDFENERLQLSSTDWTIPQPIREIDLNLTVGEDHVLLIEKTEAGGGLVKNAKICVYLDGALVLSEPDLNLLPEMGVTFGCTGARLLVAGFVHRGTPSGIPEYLHVGGWQMLNVDSVADNLDSLLRGIGRAVEEGVQLLLTPETSLTGLFPTAPVTQDRAAIAAAEAELRAFLRETRDAPYVVVGLPIWERVSEHRREETRYNVSRVYDPDGHVVSTHRKIHSCETEFWHGYRLQEFDVHGVPVGMHICHDGRYPELWTLPVMFGARLILHPANGGLVGGSIDAFEARAKRSTSTSHAFYVNVNGGGGSYIAGPQKFDNLIAVSAECQRDCVAFPMVGEPQECLIHANIRVRDAYGYWPVRSFRASEEAAAAYAALYRSLGGRNVPA